MTHILNGTLLRIGQLVLEASLTLIVGVVVAGILRRMVGSAGTRHLFGKGVNGLIKGWLAGVLLPVCSLGVIPVAREMRRSGVSGGTILSFVLAAPLLNPISFLYGLTLADPKTILCFSIFSLFISILAGYFWDYFFSGSEEIEHLKQISAIADAEAMPQYGLKRILSVFITAIRELTGRDLLFYSIGLAGSAFLAAVIPFAQLQGTMQHKNNFSPLLMTVISLFIYSTPLSGMMKIGLMFDHGNSVGAAFVLFSLGIGMCLGTLVWLCMEFKMRRVIPWFFTYLLIVLFFAYVSQPILDDPRRERIDHTHAFDEYSCPFQQGQGNIDLVFAGWKQKFTPLERPSFYGLITMLILGAVLRLSKKDEKIEAWLVSKNVENADLNNPKIGEYDIVVPKYFLAIISILGLIIFSFIAAYLYYPERKQCLDEMFSIYADAKVAISTNRPNEGRDLTQEAIRHLERWDLIARKLEVETYLRNFTLTEIQKKTAYDLREEIEAVRDFLRDGNIEEAKNVSKKLEEAFRLCKKAYGNDENTNR